MEFDNKETDDALRELIRRHGEHREDMPRGFVRQFEGQPLTERESRILSYGLTEGFVDFERLLRVFNEPIHGGKKMHVSDGRAENVMPPIQERLTTAASNLGNVHRLLEQLNSILAGPRPRVGEDVPETTVDPPPAPIEDLVGAIDHGIAEAVGSLESLVCRLAGPST